MKHSFVRHVRTVALVLVGLALVGSGWAKEIIDIIFDRPRYWQKRAERCSTHMVRDRRIRRKPEAPAG